MSTRRLFAAVRDLDPPGGGAERSLAALLNGIAAPGPTLETAPTFVPMSPAADAPTHPAWTVSAFASLDRGEPIGLLEPNVGFTTTDLPIEGFWSKVAWVLRERKGEQRRRKWAHDRHIGRRSPQFAARVGLWLDISCFNGCYGRWNSRCFLCPFKCIRESKVKYQKHGDKYMAGALLTAYALHEVQLRV